MPIMLPSGDVSFLRDGPKPTGQHSATTVLGPVVDHIVDPATGKELRQVTVPNAVAWAATSHGKWDVEKLNNVPVRSDGRYGVVTMGGTSIEIVTMATGAARQVPLDALPGASIPRGMLNKRIPLRVHSYTKHALILDTSGGTITLNADATRVLSTHKAPDYPADTVARPGDLMSDHLG